MCVCVCDGVMFVVRRMLWASPLYLHLTWQLQALLWLGGVTRAGDWAQCWSCFTFGKLQKTMSHRLKIGHPHCALSMTTKTTRYRESINGTQNGDPENEANSFHLPGLGHFERVLSTTSKTATYRK